MSNFLFISECTFIVTDKTSYKGKIDDAEEIGI